MSRGRLIVNADDLGRTSGVNAGIFEAHRSGIVTSATLMVNGLAAAEVPALSATSPKLGIGLHLQLTGGSPRLPPGRLPTLTDRNGLLPASPGPLLEADPAEILAEARAQLAYFRELMGRDPTHVDSHHHAQRVPAVFAAVVALAKETDRPVRLAEPSMAELLHRERIRTSDRFEDGFYGEAATLETLLGILGTLPVGTTELMCHPAIIDHELRRTSSYIAPRARELEVLTSDAARAAVMAAGVELTSFAAL